MSVFCNEGPKPLKQSRRTRLDNMVRHGRAFKGRITGLQYVDGLCIVAMQEIGQVPDPVAPARLLPLRTWLVYGPLDATKRLMASVFKTAGGSLGHIVYYEVDEKSGHLVSLIPDDDPEIVEVQ